MQIHHSAGYTRKGTGAMHIGRVMWIALGCTLTGALIVQSSAQHKPAQKPASGSGFRNVKVLKSMKPDQLMGAMRAFNSSLGVKCDFCHVVKPNHEGFDLDTKVQKGIARNMIVMVGNINRREKSLGGMATCYMCHHGKAMPDTKVSQ